MNLADKIKECLPAELVRLIEAIGAMAAHQDQHLYLVGGAVRDLLLERETFDLDLAVDGDAITLAQLLANITQGRLTVHTRFKTANLRWKEWRTDLTAIRSETYDQPGALPRVKPGSLAGDLFRRDFTINAMAVQLSPGHYGDLVDLYGGLEDLERGFIRVLHEKSFTDDATRIWRALRYEQRLGFQIEPETLGLLNRDIAMLDTISGDRIRHELELVLKESYPEKVFLRADELQVLPRLQPGLKCDSGLSERFEQARQISSPTPPPFSLYLALLTCNLTADQVEQLIVHLKLPRSLSQILRDSCRLNTEIASLATPSLKPSRIYEVLHGYSPSAITATSLAADSPEASRNIHQYLTRLRYIKPALTGEDLKSMGLVPGSRISEILKRLRVARMDGEVSNRQEEERLVREWLRKGA
ncbi:MAG: CCA tRNA nucleotidyltransferase [Dehalococcoidales bacterium]|nr:MAG: CCA tRNA nucleotidyltransferase [Dehalococcoidales bacterium]